MSESLPPGLSGPVVPAGAARRYALLVDAGYLYAAAGQLVLGTAARRTFRVAAEPLIAALLARAEARVSGDLLRMYWYDAARDRVPTVEQRQIAALPHVKVRLGNLNSAGQQKGVDAQVRLDLEVLARHRAVSDVVLLAGDEDMVPAVEAAQAYGVRVHVWGVEPPYGVNQAERLVWEADTVDQLDTDFFRQFLETEAEAELAGPAESAPEQRPVPAGEEPAPEAGPVEERPLVPTPADVFAGRRAAAHPVPHGQAGTGSFPARPGPDRPAMEEIGGRIAARWLLTRGRENVADLLPGPLLPTVIDKELLVEAEQEISRSLRPYEEARRALRDGFWARLHKEFGLGGAAQSAPIPAAPTATAALAPAQPAAPATTPAKAPTQPGAPAATPASAPGPFPAPGPAAAPGPASAPGPTSARGPAPPPAPARPATGSEDAAPGT